MDRHPDRLRIQNWRKVENSNFKHDWLRLARFSKPAQHLVDLLSSLNIFEVGVSHLSQPSVITYMNEQVIKLKEEGKSYREIEKITGMNRGSISYHCSALTREARRKRLLKLRNKKKLQCIEYKGGKCVICGFHQFITALDFHHLDPKTKKDSVAKLFARNQSFEKIKSELDKCILLCANCHRAIHNEEIELKNLYQQ
jgi:5-methylcytosine-specific restriction endonuclease McrA